MAKTVFDFQIAQRDSRISLDPFEIQAASGCGSWRIFRRACGYGSMGIKKALEELHDKGVDEVLLVPLYPHYAMSSYETVVVKAMEEKQKHFIGLHTMHLKMLIIYFLKVQLLVEKINHLKQNLI